MISHCHWQQECERKAIDCKCGKSEQDFFFAAIKHFQVTLSAEKQPEFPATLGRGQGASCLNVRSELKCPDGAAVIAHFFNKPCFHN
jgi:hypothetical protein